MNKLYERIDFHNNTTPALNETNLNIISKAVDDIDDRVCEIAADVIQDVPILLELAQSVEPNAERAEKAAEDAQEYAQEAATGVGANGLEYTDENILKLKRDEYVLDEVEIKSGSGNTSSWTGTKAEWEALDKSTLEDGTQVNITDDYDVDSTTIEELQNEINKISEYHQNTMIESNDEVKIGDNRYRKFVLSVGGTRIRGQWNVITTLNQGSARINYGLSFVSDGTFLYPLDSGITSCCARINPVNGQTEAYHSLAGADSWSMAICVEYSK